MISNLCEISLPIDNTSQHKFYAFRRRYRVQNIDLVHLRKTTFILKMIGKSLVLTFILKDFEIKSFLFKNEFSMEMFVQGSIEDEISVSKNVCLYVSCRYVSKASVKTTRSISFKCSLTLYIRPEQKCMKSYKNNYTLATNLCFF